jgi:hypothetical protein
LKNATYKEVATMLALELNNIELEGEVISTTFRTRKNRTSKDESTMP